MILTNLTPKIDMKPLTAVVKKIEPPKPKELSVDEKIAQNYYKCDTLTQWIRQDNATCLDKPAIISGGESVFTNSVTNSPATSGAVSSSGNLYSYGENLVLGFSNPVPEDRTDDIEESKNLYAANIITRAEARELLEYDVEDTDNVYFSSLTTQTLPADEVPEPALEETPAVGER